MSDEANLQRAKRPKGVMLLVVLFYLAAGLVVLSALSAGNHLIPSDISAFITMYLIILGWGLWKLHRWAWAATLLMLLLSVFYTLSNSMLLNTPVGWPLLFIAITSAYLLWPNIRRMYWHNGWLPAPDQAVAHETEA